MVRRRLLAAVHFPRWLHHSANPVALQSDAGTAAAAPSRLTRLPESASWQTDTTETSPQQILDSTADELRSRRWRVRTQEFEDTTGWVSAEKGYLRETGNLLFHISLLALLFAVAFGGMYGWRGQALVIEGESFTGHDHPIRLFQVWSAGRCRKPPHRFPSSSTTSA